MSKKILIGIFVVIVILATGISLWISQQSQKGLIGPSKKVTIAVLSPSFSSYVIYIASGKDYFKQEGLDVTLDIYPHGKASLNAVMEGRADMGTCSETPFMHAVLDEGKLYAIASMITGEKHLAVVGRKDKGITIPKDLIGKSIGVTFGSNGEYFLDTILLLNGISRNQIKPVYLKPAQMFDALIKGEVDAIATWNPQMFKAKNKLEDQGSVFYAKGMYSPYFIIAGRQDFIKANPDITERLVQSLINASKFINDNPAESHEIVARFLKIDESLLENISATYHFKISLDQSFIRTLETQTRWAMENKYTDQTRLPDYLDYIYLDALASLKPENVTIIR
jgi:ABC-type nitrate/sulfonate/bicarbonate transport system substrate-binding protein